MSVQWGGQEHQPKNVINPKMAPNNHEHTNSTWNVETNKPTLTNNCLQPKPTSGVHKESVVEDAVVCISWGSPDVNGCVASQTPEDFTAHMEMHPLKHLLSNHNAWVISM